MTYDRKTCKKFQKDLLARQILKYTLILGSLILILGGFYSLLTNGIHSLLEKDLFTIHCTSEKYETLTWVIELYGRLNSGQESDIIAKYIAKEVGLVNMGKVGKLPYHFLMAHPWHEHGLFWPGINLIKTNKDEPKYWHQQLNVTREWSRIKNLVNKKLASHTDVLHFYQQSAVKRVKRSWSMIPEIALKRNLSSSISEDTHFNDPLFPKQWHLKNILILNHDMNVTGVWERNITGRGVTVAIVDDGLDWQSPDIKPNYNPEGSIDVVSNDDDPSPSNLKKTNYHGTRCAGEIAAAANNKFCGVGVAYGSRVAGIRLIEGPMTDEAEARAFSEKLSTNDIYSCSWGPEDDGKTLDGPHKLATKALRLGTDFGRNGYGSIYVVASGNGGSKGDNCNYDGYANSIYTVTIGAVDEFGMMPYYSEECASMLAVAYSSGSGSDRNVVTSDWSLYGGSGCTENHSGTSAAAPLAAGVVALMLETRPCLTWRDVQYLIVTTAIKIDVEGSTWTKNAAGFHHSHQHGFGIMNAWKLVNAAKVWKSVPWMTSFSTAADMSHVEVWSGQEIECLVNVSKSDLDSVGLKTLEYVHLILTLSHDLRGQVEIQLLCPSGTNSILGATRSLDDSKEGLKDWVFSTVRCWGEEGFGTWTVKIIDHGDQNVNIIRGYVKKWRLQLYGSSMTPKDVAYRIKLSEEASDGRFLNSSFQMECDPAPVKMKVGKSISERYLKILIIIGAFVVTAALSDMLEYSMCYQKEKQNHSKFLALVDLARSLVRGKAQIDRAGESLQLAPLLNASSAKEMNEDLPMRGGDHETCIIQMKGGEGYTSTDGLYKENTLSAVHLNPLEKVGVEERNDMDVADADDDDEIHLNLLNKNVSHVEGITSCQEVNVCHLKQTEGFIKRLILRFKNRSLPLFTNVLNGSQVPSNSSLSLNMEACRTHKGDGNCDDDNDDCENDESAKLLAS